MTEIKFLAILNDGNFTKKYEKKEVIMMKDDLTVEFDDPEKIVSEEDDSVYYIKKLSEEETNDSEDMDEAGVTFADRSYQVYVRQARKIQRFTLEQELELGREISELEDLIYFPVSWSFVSKTSFEIAKMRKRYVPPNLLWVVKVARKLWDKKAPLLDIVQEGNLGLIKAAEKFDPRRGKRFSTYSTWWIRQSIDRFFKDHGRNVKIPIHAWEKMSILKKTSEDLLRELEREPSESEIAEKLEKSVEEIKEMKRINALSEISIFKCRSDEDDEIVASDIISFEFPFEEYCDQGSRRDKIEKVLATLKPKEEDVIRLRLGLNGDPIPWTLDQIGKKYGVSRERIRQIESKALKKLKHISRTKELKDFAF